MVFYLVAHRYRNAFDVILFGGGYKQMTKSNQTEKIWDTSFRILQIR